MKSQEIEQLNEISNKLYKTDYKYIGLDSCKITILEQYLESLSPNKEVVSDKVTIVELNEALSKGYRKTDYDPEDSYYPLWHIWKVFDSMRSKQSEPSKWISVEERLPEKPYKDVLVYSKLGVVGLGFYDMDYMRMNSNQSHIGNITHWQPLPAPPTKQEGEKG